MSSSLAAVRTYQLAFSIGGLGDYSKLVVDSSGECIYEFRDAAAEFRDVDAASPDCERRAKFRLSDDELAWLNRLIRSRAFLSLAGSYSFPDEIADGTQAAVRLEADDCVLRTWCDNYFPPPIVRLQGFVSELERSHQAELAASPFVTLRNNDPSSLMAP